MAAAVETSVVWEMKVTVEVGVTVAAAAVAEEVMKALV